MKLAGSVTEPNQGLCQPFLRSLGSQSSMAVDEDSQVAKSEVQAVFCEQRVQGNELADDGVLPGQDLTVRNCFCGCHIGRRTLQYGHQPDDVSWHQLRQHN